MSNGWTEERKARQREMIRTWRPWEKSTGPRTETGKQVSSRNAVKPWLAKLRQRLVKGMQAPPDG